MRTSFCPFQKTLPFQIDEPNVNAGTVVWYQTGGNGDQRTLEDNEIEQVNTNTTATIESTVNSDATVTGEEKKFPLVSFKETNSTQSHSPNGRKKSGKKKKPKKKKSRVNREILQTLLSRKKFYKILEHKLDMLVEYEVQHLAEFEKLFIKFISGLV